MKVYLVQHAEAKPKEEDPDRPLSELGRVHAEHVAAVAAKLGLQVDEIRHSGKTRAEQTAAILGAVLSPSKGVCAATGLGPADDVVPVADDLEAASKPIMLVGHLPFLERLTGYLVTGNAGQAVVRFNKAAIVCLEQDCWRWHVTWILTPDIAAVQA